MRRKEVLSYGKEQFTRLTRHPNVAPILQHSAFMLVVDFGLINTVVQTEDVAHHLNLEEYRKAEETTLRLASAVLLTIGTISLVEIAKDTENTKSLSLEQEFVIGSESQAAESASPA